MATPVFTSVLRRCFVSLTLLFALSAFAAESKKSFDIAAGDAATSLQQFSRQSGAQVIFGEDSVAGTSTNAVKGEYTADDAMKKLLTGSGLKSTRDEKSGSFAVNRKPSLKPAESPNAPRVAQAATTRTSSQNSDRDENAAIKLDTFEVMDSKLLNMDKPRSRDDAQPYVIFDRVQLERSGATTVDDFFKQRLTMNTQGQSPSQFPSSSAGNTSQINLRGLGPEQTLILVDGHRIASYGNSGGLLQPDLNAIPLAAIERIEILPTTASGIYGGSATGGVVNVILRRDYNGAELRVTYENTFKSDAAVQSVDLSAGFTLEGGKTNVLLAFNFKDANNLWFQDRDYFADGRARILANNPAGILGITTPLLGSTPNIRSANGSNLTLRSGPALNSPITFVPAGYAGTADGGAALVANAGHYNFGLADSGQTAGLGGAGGRLGAFNAPEVVGAMATVRRQFSPWFQGFLEAAASNNSGRFSLSGAPAGVFSIPAGVATNPFNQAISITLPVAGNDVVISDEYSRRVVVGGLAQLPNDWMAEADYTWSRVRFYSSSPSSLSTGVKTAVTAGTLDVLRDLRAYPVDFTPYLLPPGTEGPTVTTLYDGSVRASGPTFSLPAGPISLSASLEYRFERLSDSFSTSSFGPLFRPHRSQSATSAYVEARIPLVSKANRLPWIRELELQVAGRRDDYVVNGVTSSITPGSATPIVRVVNRNHSANPTVGLKFSPVDDVTFRASYGTGFLPPSVTQLVPTAPTLLTLPALDPKRGLTPIVTNVASGGNPDLRPEKSKSWGGGIVLTPRVAPGLRISVDYTRIRKTDNIISNLLSSTVAVQTFVNDEASFPSRIVRGPNLATDPAGWAGPITLLDVSAVNLATAEVEAVDLAVDYRLETPRWGAFEVFGAGTRQLRYDTQVVAGAPVINNVGVNSLITSIPVRNRINGGLTWIFNRWTTGWVARYTDSYLTRDPSQATNATIIANQGNGGRVGSEIVYDLFTNYKFGQRGSWGARLTNGTEVQFGIKNVFDRPASFDAGNQVLLYNYLGDTHGRAYYVSVKRTF